jgi:hypothetical protein
MAASGPLRSVEACALGALRSVAEAVGRDDFSALGRTVLPGRKADVLSLLEISVTAVGWGVSRSMQPKWLDAHSDGADRQPPGRQ